MLYKVTNYSFNSIMAEGKYCKHYYPGSMVASDPKTLGLMLFQTLKQAISFSSSYGYARILEVEAFGELDIPNILSVSSDEFYMDDFYRGKNTDVTLIPPPGTVCCRAVRVIREIQHQ